MTIDTAKTPTPDVDATEPDNTPETTSRALNTCLLAAGGLAVVLVALLFAPWNLVAELLDWGWQGFCWLVGESWRVLLVITVPLLVLGRCMADKFNPYGRLAGQRHWRTLGLWLFVPNGALVVLGMCALAIVEGDHEERAEPMGKLLFSIGQRDPAPAQRKEYLHDGIAAQVDLVDTQVQEARMVGLSYLQCVTMPEQTPNPWQLLAINDGQPVRSSCRPHDNTLSFRGPTLTGTHEQILATIDTTLGRVVTDPGFNPLEQVDAERQFILGRFLDDVPWGGDYEHLRQYPGQYAATRPLNAILCRMALSTYRWNNVRMPGDLAEPLWELALVNGKKPLHHEQDQGVRLCSSVSHNVLTFRRIE